MIIESEEWAWGRCSSGRGLEQLPRPSIAYNEGNEQEVEW